MEKIEGKKRKIAIIAGSRGEYGYFRPIIKEMMRRKILDYGIIATNMHVLDTFGSSIEEIKKDGFNIAATVYNTLDGYNHLTMVKSLAIFMLQLPEILKQMNADMILLAGDRGEQLTAAIVGAHMYIPVFHIQAGEASGNIDGLTRHAITKFAHVHFAANVDAAERLLKMGEEPQRVHNVGAPMLDELVSGFMTPKEEIYKKFKLQKGKPVLLMVQHAVTEEFDKTEAHVAETMNALAELGHQTIIVLNNSDAGSRAVRNAILKYKKNFMHVVPNLPRQDYVGLLTVCGAMVGNSSSGIIEAPVFKLPAVNIGGRQAGRLQGNNVINVGYSADEITRAVKLAFSPAFKKKMRQGASSPYGDGNSAKRIVDIMENIPIDDKLLVKKMTY